MGGYIDRQVNEEVKHVRWGRLSTVGRGGCGAVAAYNVAVALGKNPDFQALVRAMEKSRMPALGGLLGTNVFRLWRWLRRHFGRAEICLFGAEGWEEKTRFCRVAVIFYKNKGAFKGNHFVAAGRTPEGFVFHNAPVLPSDRAFPMDRAVEVLKKAGHMPLIPIVL